MHDQSNNLFSEKSLAISTPNVGLWCARRDSNPHDFTHCHLKAARLPIPPRALGIPAARIEACRINGADVTNQGWRDKAVLHPNSPPTTPQFQPHFLALHPHP